MMVRETDLGYEVVEVSYDRDARMAKTETVIETYPTFKAARARAWQISEEKGI